MSCIVQNVTNYSNTASFAKKSAIVIPRTPASYQKPSKTKELYGEDKSIVGWECYCGDPCKGRGTVDWYWLINHRKGFEDQKMTTFRCMEEGCNTEVPSAKGPKIFHCMAYHFDAMCGLIGKDATADPEEVQQLLFDLPEKEKLMYNKETHVWEKKREFVQRKFIPREKKVYRPKVETVVETVAEPVKEKKTHLPPKPLTKSWSKAVLCPLVEEDKVAVQMEEQGIVVVEEEEEEEQMESYETVEIPSTPPQKQKKLFVPNAPKKAQPTNSIKIPRIVTKSTYLTRFCQNGPNCPIRKSVGRSIPCPFNHMFTHEFFGTGVNVAELPGFCWHSQSWIGKECSNIFCEFDHCDGHVEFVDERLSKKQ